MACSTEDRRWMLQALALAVRAPGSTTPNPRVGCVLVRDGVAVGAGLHRGAGLGHAEAVAVAEAGDAARGACAYVTLEPCAHHGRTAPCSDALIRSGVERVVAAGVDPDPRVNGRGFAALEQAGVRVECGLLGREAARINEGFFLHHETARPLVTLKAAVSLDGRLSAAQGVSRWITSPAARRVTHRLRLDHDAVLVGAGTVRADDPRLTVRLGGGEVRRRIVVLSSSLRIDPRARIFAGGDPKGVLVYTGSKAGEAAGRNLAGRATVICIGETEDGLRIDEVLADLGRRGVYSVLVEGGGVTLARFLGTGMAQRAALFQAPLTLGAEGATPMLAGAAVASPAAGWRLEREGVFAVGVDQWTVGRWREGE
jgi:diaminohydroxyphosphoribosylaminopyrimidine deaminase/5-amino-6-(5-phosphoribosylamino)uracil reductase